MAKSGTQDSIIIILQIIYKGTDFGSAELCIEINEGRKSKDYLCDSDGAELVPLPGHSLAGN